MTGVTASDTFPTTSDAYQSTLKMADAFLTEFTLDFKPPIAVAGPDITIDQHETSEFNGTASHDQKGVANWTWSFWYDGEKVELYGPTPSFTFHIAGSYLVDLLVTDMNGNWGTDDLNVTVRDITPPVANAGNSRFIDQHQTLIFDGIDSVDNVDVVNWTWTFVYDDSPVTLFGPDPEFTFNKAGEYNVTLNITDAVGLFDIDYVIVHVLDLTNPIADAGTDMHVDQHERLILNGTGCSDNVGIVNWTWGLVYGGVPTSLYGETVEFRFDLAGEFEVTLLVEDGVGNRAFDTMTITVVDITSPVATAGEDMEVDPSTTVYFDATGSVDNVRIASYRWTFEYQGVDIDLEGDMPTYIFEAAGSYEVTLTVTDPAGNVAIDTTIVKVRDLEPPVADAGDDKTVDQGGTVTFNASDSTDNVGVVMWVWCFRYNGSQGQFNLETFQWTFDLAGEYAASLTVYDAEGFKDTDVMMVFVSDTTSPNAIAGPDRVSDQGGTVTLDGSGSTDNMNVSKWTWTFDYEGTGRELTGETTTFKFETPGDYTITLTVEDTVGNSDGDQFFLHVRDTVEPTLPKMGNVEVGSGDKVSLDASGATDNVGIVNWTWTFKEGGKTVTLEGMQVEHTFKEAGDYEVTLTVEDEEGNLATETFTVSVSSNTWLWLTMLVVVVIVVMFIFRNRMGVNKIR